MGNSIIAIDQYKFSCLEQGSAEWHKARLGYFSSSQVGLLMQKPRKHITDSFSQTAMNYIYDVAAKRRILPQFLEGDGWTDYVMRTELHNRAIQWGKDFEPYARKKYEEVTGTQVNECGFILHPEVDWLGDSPDGIVCDEHDQPIGAVELKCPDSKTYVRYEDSLVNLGVSLKIVNPDYYWQCLCHIACNKVQWCDFCVYDPMLKDGFFRIRIDGQDAEVKRDIYDMEEAVDAANRIVIAISK